MLRKVLKTIVCKIKWRKLNKHNGTTIARYCDINKISVGCYTYGEVNALIHSDENFLKIGHFCSIGPNTVFSLSAEHHIDRISTFPFKVKVLGDELYEATSKGDIVVGDDVWIGCNVTILSGVHIGQGAVIGAGAVVVKDVPPYAVVGGVPAKILKFRFDDSIIKKLLRIDYSKLDRKIISEHLSELYLEYKEDDELEWMPLKS